MDETDRAANWRARGRYFRWRPRDGDEVAVFHVESGHPDRPVLLLVHGFPTCSVDWFELVALLDGRYRVCALDFPGYGFSDKPVGWGYSLVRDAELLDYYVREVVGARSLAVLAHDRGSSVALNYLLGTRPGGPPTSRATITHLVLTNANLFLPLSNLTAFQRQVLDGATAPALLGALTPELLAAGMGAVTFSPPRPAEHPDVAALASTFAHDDGVRVLHETIQYLVERAENERDWLVRLAASEVPTTVIWGLLDTVSPPRVAARVWDDYLALKPGRNLFYLVPGANHYLQVDQPARLAEAFLHAEGGGAETPGPLDARDGAPVLMDWSRARLPHPTEVLRADTPA